MTAEAALAGSILADPGSLPPLPYAELDAFGPTLVAAPHPDDESLGSGGLIALLHDRGVPVRILVLTDGTGSHPASRAYPAPRLREVREAEARAAAARLGLAPDAVTFLREPDGALALPDDPGHAEVVERCRALLDEHAIRTVVTTWRRDPHRDHRAAWRIVSEAVARTRPRRPRLLEVPIWLWVRAAPGDAPAAGEAAGRRLDIAAVLERKRAAVAAHRSQTSDLIDDDPQGFRLAPEMLAYFVDRPFEVYLEAEPAPPSSRSPTPDCAEPAHPPLAAGPSPISYRRTPLVRTRTRRRGIGRGRCRRPRSSARAWRRIRRRTAPAPARRPGGPHPHRASAPNTAARHRRRSPP